jgi:hypothetical protein
MPKERPFNDEQRIAPSNRSCSSAAPSSPSRPSKRGLTAVFGARLHQRARLPGQSARESGSPELRLSASDSTRPNGFETAAGRRLRPRAQRGAKVDQGLFASSRCAKSGGPARGWNAYTYAELRTTICVVPGLHALAAAAVRIGAGLEASATARHACADP